MTNEWEQLWKEAIENSIKIEAMLDAENLCDELKCYIMEERNFVYLFRIINGCEITITIRRSEK